MNTVLSRAKESVLLCTREKAQRVTAINAVPLSRFDHIVTDSPEMFPDYRDHVVGIA